MRYDAIVIGAGQAGPGLASNFASEGQKIALIEGDKLGGTCLNYGCRPTKTLRASARVAYQARRAAEYGVNVGDVSVDFRQVMARKNDIIGSMQDSFTNYITHLDNVDVYRAYGRFVGTSDGVHQVQAGDDLLESERVYLNTGTRPNIPPIDGIDSVPYLTNESLLYIDELPQHMIVIGGGIISVEFGQMFRRFGSAITIIETRPYLMGNEDDDIGAAVEDIFRAEGITVLCGNRATAVSQAGDGTITVTLQNQRSGETQTVTGSHVLLATGRKPNSDNLNAGAVGLNIVEGGFIETNTKYETNVPGIWALGDVNGRGAFTHTSYQDYEIALANYRGGDRSADERYWTYAVFIDPPLGRVGMDEQAARASDRNILMAVYPMNKVSRARLEGETDGLMKIIVDADTEEILGATVLGMQGDDVIQIFSNFMYTGAPYTVMRDALPVHPTIAEFLPTVLATLKPLSEYDQA